MKGRESECLASEREDKWFPRVISIGEKCLPNGVNTKAVLREGRRGLGKVRPSCQSLCLAVDASTSKGGRGGRGSRREDQMEKNTNRK